MNNENVGQSKKVEEKDYFMVKLVIGLVIWAIFLIWMLWGILTNGLGI